MSKTIYVKPYAECNCEIPEIKFRKLDLLGYCNKCKGVITVKKWEMLNLKLNY